MLRFSVASLQVTLPKAGDKAAQKQHRGFCPFSDPSFPSCSQPSWPHPSLQVTTVPGSWFVYKDSQLVPLIITFAKPFHCESVQCDSRQVWKEPQPTGCRRVWAGVGRG